MCLYVNQAVHVNLVLINENDDHDDDRHRERERELVVCIRGVAELARSCSWAALMSTL